MATKKVHIDILAKDKTRAALRGAQKGINNLKSSVLNLKVALAGIGGAVVARSFLNTARDIERLQVRLKFLFGSAEEGAKAFDKMAKFASKVPFSLGEIQQGAGVLSVVSKDANELAKIMELTGNVAAVTGLDFRTTAEQIQRSLSAGISAADLFRERGVKAMLGFKAGATVSVEETAEAFDRVFGPNGQFGKATNELAKTFDGVLSMIGDKIFLFKKTTMEAGLFDFLTAQLKVLDQIVAENFGSLERGAESLGQTIEIAMRKIMIGSARVLDTMRPVFDFFVESASNMFKFLNSLPEGVRATGIIGFLMLGRKGKLLVLAIGGLFDDIGRAINKGLESIGLDASFQFGKIGEMAADIFKADTIDTSNLKNALDTIIVGAGQSESAILKFLERSDEIVEQGKRAEYELAKFAHLRKLRANEQMDLLDKEKEKVSDMARMYDGFAKGFKDTMEKSKDMFKSFETVGKNAFLNLQKTLTDFVMTGKLNFQSLKEVIIRSIVEALIGKAVASAVTRATEMFKFEAVRRAMISVYEGALKTFASIPFPFNIAAAGLAIKAGMSLVSKIKGFEKGGNPPVGVPSLVGEAGPELFVPKSAGTIVPNHALGGREPVNVNFNINTVDARGFNELLVNSRGVIVNMINSAVNEKGRQAII